MSAATPAEPRPRLSFYLLHGPAVSIGAFDARQAAFASLLEPIGLYEWASTMVVGGVTQVLRHHFLDSPEADPRFLLKSLTDFVALYSSGPGCQAAA